MYKQISSCPQCGAPVYVPSIWLGVVPPTPTYSCACRNIGRKNWNPNNSSLNDNFNNKNINGLHDNHKEIENFLETFEATKNEEIRQATESLKEAFEKNGLIKEQLSTKDISKKLESLEQKIEILSNQIKLLLLK